MPADKFQIRSIFGIIVNEESSAVKLWGAFLDRLGLKLKCVGRLGSRDDRQRYYRLLSLDPDGRGEVFWRWRERDALNDRSVFTAPGAEPETEPVPTELAASVEEARDMLEAAIDEPVGLTRDVMDIVVSSFKGVKRAGRWIWKALSARARNWVRDLAPEGYRWLTG
jgi:hypothetical protein